MQIMLVPFGYVFTIVILLAILVPYLRGRSDLITSWNLFLLGSAYFIGMASVQAGFFLDPYYTFDSMDFIRFMGGSVLFYVAVFIVYHKFKAPRRWAGRRFRKWPARSTAVLFFLLPICAMLALGTLYPLRIPGIGLIIFTLGKNAAIVALVLAFVAWYQQPVNPLLFWTLAAVAIFGLLITVLGGSGRRPMLSLLVALPICYYWMRLRYLPARRTLIILGVMGFACIVVLGAYSTVRHTDWGMGFTTERAIAKLKRLPQKLARFEGVKLLIPSDTTKCSLVAIHRYTHDVDPEPFYTLYYVASNPIPKAVWPRKPLALGYRLPRDVGQWARTGFINWGPGIVGHGYHEGGLFFIVFYAVLIGAALAFFDELIIQQSNNPYLLAMLCSVASNIIAFSRGDMGVFTMQIVASVVAIWLIGLLGRMLMGTGTVYPTVNQIHSQSQIQHH